MTGQASIGPISTRSSLPVIDEEAVDPAPLPKHELLATLYPETVHLLADAWGPDWESYL